MRSNVIRLLLLLRCRPSVGGAVLLLLLLLLLLRPLLNL
jgi:hypothetical protein